MGTTRLIYSGKKRFVLMCELCPSIMLAHKSFHLRKVY